MGAHTEDFSFESPALTQQELHNLSVFFVRKVQDVVSARIGAVETQLSPAPHESPGVSAVGLSPQIQNEVIPKACTQP